jgi:hypothetical protein
VSGWGGDVNERTEAESMSMRHIRLQAHAIKVPWMVNNESMLLAGVQFT